MNASPRFARLGLALACSALILASAPVHADALQDISKAIRQGQHAQALDQADRYLAGKPKDPQARFLRGIALTELNRTNDAITVFQKLTEDFPELPEPYNNLAVIYAQQKQYDKAKSALEMAIRTHPAYATAHENLGDIYARMASQAYDKALQLDSSNASAQGKLAMIRDLMTGSTRPGSRPTGKPTDTKTVEVKPVDTKPVESKPIETKPADTKPTVVATAPTTSTTPAATATATKTEPAPAKPEVTPAKPEVSAAAKPETPVPTKPEANTAEQDDIARTVNQWAAAWAAKDANAYLAYYAKDFNPPKGQNRKAWEAERRARIDKPGAIVIRLDDIKVKVDGSTASARFRQYYQSGSLKSTTGKTLDLIQANGKWLIQQERVGG